MGLHKGLSKRFNLGALLNPEPEIPEGAIQFEGTEDYIFFEGQSAPDYITFETI